MNFPNAVATAFRRYAVFSGRSGRPEFWWFALLIAVLTVATNALDATMFSSLVSDPSSGFTVGAGPLNVILTLVTIVPTLAVSARRFHDIGRSGWWTLVWLIPVVGWIWAIYLCAQEGQPAANEYGPVVPASELSTT